MLSVLSLTKEAGILYIGHPIKGENKRYDQTKMQGHRVFSLFMERG